LNWNATIVKYDFVFAENVTAVMSTAPTAVVVKLR
jgi:hypothetical protein